MRCGQPEGRTRKTNYVIWQVVFNSFARMRRRDEVVGSWSQEAAAARAYPVHGRDCLGLLIVHALRG